MANTIERVVDLARPAVSYCIIGLAGLLALLIYRLYLHPLSHVPGRRFAAATGLYEFYYDGCLGGKYYWEIMRMHDEYGPVVRISPNAVHINDPDFFDRFYNVTGRLDKDPRFYRMLGLPQSTFQTTSHDLHRVRRKPISKFFTPAAVTKAEGILNRNLDTLLVRLDSYKEAARPVNLSDALRCLSTDNISEYVLPQGPELLRRDAFAASYNCQIRDLGIISLWNRTFPFLLPLSMMTPRWIVKLFAPSGALETFDVQMDIGRQAIEIANSAERSDRTVIHGLVNSDLPAEEKRPQRVLQDAWGLILAGTETTAVALETIVFHLLSNTDTLQRLHEELSNSEAVGGSLACAANLRKLPYLGGVISEGLRLASPVSGRLARIDHKTAYSCSGVVLPPGTSISMSISAMHSNASTFEEPRAFKPERFLQPSQKKHSEMYLVPFGKGSRVCVGQEFALNSICLTLVRLLKRFDVQLYETTIQDIEMAHEMFAPFPAANARGVRVLLR